MVLAVKIASSFGALEYWGVGKSKSLSFNLNCSFHYSITPALHYSGRRSHEEKVSEALSVGSSKQGPLSPASLLGFVSRAKLEFSLSERLRKIRVIFLLLT